ncbi:aminotransferase class V-fold PLP-dependent enzyme [Pricia sp. S334]|uniref:Aminotransferase class V-fold PLP-dependent enzyme n=1 Tax=Pricia mediterranea TaxID=3076079 RepID=A0ABU3L3F1_9FLAO|nr:aminotransferase class V-fold PLP-dependent enzyme [Pricia sp. S334]MDT7828150.1 aminotransferase class V-fold PLP-dependent enzyme [Pricia sp. S334]
MENTKKQFSVFKNYIYADTAAAGLLSDSLRRWRQQHDRDYSNGGSLMKIKAMQDDIPKVRKTVADYFGAKTENTALVPNFSLGLNMLIEGLAPDSKILLVRNDYPSVNWPFENRDFEISYAALDANLEDNILEKVKMDRVSVLVLSLVQWIDGIKIDMDFLKSLKKEYPDLIIIADGTQFCGTTDFNFGDSGIDVLGASSYKWLLGGFGNGFFLFQDEVKKRFSLKTAGFNSAGGNLNRPDDIPFARHLEPGHLDTLNFGSLKFALEYLQALGKSKIEVHLERLSKKAKKEFGGLGLLDGTTIARKSHSTIFNVAGKDKLYQRLSDNGVICSKRGGGIRLSFHLYNTEKDIDTIVKILKTGG